GTPSAQAESGAGSPSLRQRTWAGSASTLLMAASCGGSRSSSDPPTRSMTGVTWPCAHRYPGQMENAQTISTAGLFDERGDALGCSAEQCQGLGGRRACAGPIRTVRCFRDTALVKSLLATPGDGAVLAIDGRC